MSNIVTLDWIEGSQTLWGRRGSSHREIEGAVVEPEPVSAGPKTLVRIWPVGPKHERICQALVFLGIDGTEFVSVSGEMSVALPSVAERHEARFYQMHVPESILAPKLGNLSNLLYRFKISESERRA